MTHGGQHVDDAALDDVARAYAAAEFRETPPPHVDDSILDRAARESQHRKLRSAFRPAHVAWAAVIVLALSVVLEFALRTPPVPTTGVESSRRAQGSDAAAPREAREAPVSDAASGGAGDDAVRAFASDGDPDAARRVQEVTRDPAAIGCAEHDRATPEDWLACIEALQRDAYTILAAELAAFRERHPDHILPPALPRDGR